MWGILPHEASKVFSDFMMAGLVERVSRGEEDSFASECNIVTIQLASG